MTTTDVVDDEVKLIRHRLIARRLAVDPEMIDRARQRFEGMAAEYGEADFVVEWRTILDAGLLKVRRRLVARDEDAYRLRLSSPFSTVSGLPLSDEALRRRIWRIGQRLVRRRQHRLLAEIYSEMEEIGSLTPKL